MNKMQVPKSIRRLRFEKPAHEKSAIDIEITSVKYLISVIQRVVNSEKYILNKKVLVLDVNLNADKIKITKALEGISDAKVVKVTSSNRKSQEKYFKGRLGTVSGYKRMYITTSAPFDLGLLFGGSDESGN